MDEIPDAEYKVVEHQIAPPLDPSPRWRFQRLARGIGSGLDDASYAELTRRDGCDDAERAGQILFTLDSPIINSNRMQITTIVCELSFALPKI